MGKVKVQSLKRLGKIKWFHQTKNYGLGNFVMATPALRLLRSVNVYFESPSIRSLYKECKFIKILKSMPKGNRAFCSSKPLQNTRLGRESDSEAYCRVVAGRASNIPNTYVDKSITRCLKKKSNVKYVAVFHGCLNDRPKVISRKDIGCDIRQHMIKSILAHGMVPVLLGNKQDHKKFWSRNDLSHCVNHIGRLSLRDSVSILQQCDCFMSNDTGLYHVAGALKKSGLVVWRLTNPVKNKSTFAGIKHLINRKAARDMLEIDNFLGKL